MAGLPFSGRFIKNSDAAKHFDKDFIGTSVAVILNISLNCTHRCQGSSEKPDSLHRENSVSQSRLPYAVCGGHYQPTN